MALFPGIPSLPSGVSAIFSTIALLTRNLLGFNGITPQWGIFKDGDNVVAADTVLSVSFRQDYRISNYPIEQGSFASYNKVQEPYQIRIRFATGGSIQDREALINSIAAIIGSTELFDVVTPEVTYTNLNPVGQSYDRLAEKGSGLLTIDVLLEQVRPAAIAQSSVQVATQTGNSGTTIPLATSSSTASTGRVAEGFAAIGSSKDPGAESVVNGGNVQPLSPTAEQQSVADKVLAQSSLPF